MELLIRLMRLLWYMELAGVVVLLLRLAYLQVYRRYPALMLFLALDLTGAVGLSYSTRSLTYYWTYFFANNVLGSALFIWMCREMFTELYGYHPGLRGVTRFTLKRSILIGASVAFGTREK